MRPHPRQILLTVAALIAVPALGHHSAGPFDFGRTMIVEGTVKLIEVRNPHTKLVLEVAQDDGGARDIEFEGHSRHNVYRRGWRPDMVRAGDRITIVVAPTRDGSDGGYVTSFRLEDNTEF
jgi:hypothetical protein